MMRPRAGRLCPGIPSAINAAAEEPEPSTFRQAKVCGRQAEVCGRPACVAQIAKMLARVLRVGV